jgi:hypothetical protein
VAVIIPFPSKEAKQESWPECRSPWVKREDPHAVDAVLLKSVRDRYGDHLQLED